MSKFWDENVESNCYEGYGGFSQDHCIDGI